MSKTYTTVQGDMLDRIAYTQLGSVSYTGKLMDCNPLMLDYYIFPAGVVLTLPEIETRTADSRPPWKKASG